MLVNMSISYNLVLSPFLCKNVCKWKSSEIWDHSSHERTRGGSKRDGPTIKHVCTKLWKQVCYQSRQVHVVLRLLTTRMSGVTRCGVLTSCGVLDLKLDPYVYVPSLTWRHSHDEWSQAFPTLTFHCSLLSFNGKKSTTITTTTNKDNNNNNHKNREGFLKWGYISHVITMVPLLYFSLLHWKQQNTCHWY